ncbi:ABC transporter permease [Sphingobacterium corticis]|uniref:ABC transporter permease n=1 Tax=Sphingobacterium corticis TaxID=1812823 RepID=A0ABW5NN06_9SPHI
MKTYNIKSTLRYLWKNKLFTALNIVGLSIGISACWLVFSIVQYEFSFDKGIPDAEHIYQITSDNEYEGEVDGFAGVPLGLPPLLVEESLDDALVVPMYSQYFERLFTNEGYKNTQLTFDEQEGIIGTLPTYFELLPYEWIIGNPKSAFAAPKQIVLTENRAKRYFPNTDPADLIGEVMLLDTIEYAISGVVKNLSFPSSFPAEVFTALPQDKWNNHNWSAMNSAHLLFIKTKNKASLDHLLTLANKRYKETAAEGHAKMGLKVSFTSFPLPEKHFEPQYDTDGLVVEKKVVYGLIAIGGFLLILACINYINLSTAQVPQRAKEIGIRKTLGARPSTLTWNFFAETFSICLFALILSWPIVSIFRKVYPEFIPDGLVNFSNPWLITAFVFGLTILIAVFTSLYPSYLINKLRSIETLKGKMETRIQGTRLTLRKGLIIFQFIIAQFFIVGAMIMAYQLNFTLNKNLGFEHDAVVTVRMPYKSYQNADVDPLLYKHALAKRPEISKIAMGHEPQNSNHWGSIYYLASDTGQIQLSSAYKYVDEDFIDLYEINLLAGENLPHGDTMRNVLINETALKMLGMNNPEDAIGKKLTYDAERSHTILGVFKDFHQKSLRNKMEPLLFESSTKSGHLQVFHIKLPKDRQQWKKTFATMESEWKKLYPDAPFSYEFVDEKIKNLYETEHRTAKLVDLATAVTIFISCLGLFGLATLTAFQRTKEIGVRKVLGASVSGIVGLLSKDFVKLVLIAIIIASPIAWWAMNKWLEDFAYRIDIQWWMFALAGVLAIAVALLTISYQAIRAAITNPVNSLRDE